jgi:hypothetical protein
MQQLTGLDACFSFRNANAPMHVGFIMIYDQSTAPGGYVPRISRTSSGIARCFRQRLVHVPLNLDHPYWIEDPDFDLEFHVRHIALPRPGDWRQLCIQVARLHSRPLDHNHPLWEIYVIEGLDNVPSCREAASRSSARSITRPSTASPVPVHRGAPRSRPGAEPHRRRRRGRPMVRLSTADLLTRTMFNNVIYPFRLGRAWGVGSGDGAVAVRHGVQDSRARATHPLQRHGDGTPGDVRSSTSRRFAR